MEATRMTLPMEGLIGMATALLMRKNKIKALT